jgi:hypothetical protein
MSGFGPGETAGSFRIPAPNEEKPVSSAGSVLKERASFERTLFAKYDPAV